MEAFALVVSNPDEALVAFTILNQGGGYIQLIEDGGLTELETQRVCGIWKVAASAKIEDNLKSLALAAIAEMTTDQALGILTFLQDKRSDDKDLLATISLLLETISSDDEYIHDAFRCMLNEAQGANFSILAKAILDTVS